MPATECNQCGSNELTTDLTAGNVVCSTCGNIVETNLLVSEVGFAEGSGGRMHVQGAFVAHGSTGISGLRGRGGESNSTKVKEEGHKDIEKLARRMHLGRECVSRAARSFGLAVDHKFNRGRKREYVVASCVYMACRATKEPWMLIDFSDRMQVNVFELANTYMKLRQVLHLDKKSVDVPEHDPAIFNVHFARQLDFEGKDHTKVAADASRLVRRFKADWMTQGRRPSGICGACLMIAARMSNYLRTVEEVAVVVKCSPTTIRRRLREFAQTQMSKKSVAEWRQLDEAQLDEAGETEPPVVREQRLKREKAERERLDAEQRAQELADRENEEDGGEGEDGGSQAGSHQNENDEEDEDMDNDHSGPSKKRKTNKGKAKATGTADEDDIPPSGQGKGKGRAKPDKGKGRADGKGKRGKATEGTSAPDFEPLNPEEAITRTLRDHGLFIDADGILDDRASTLTAAAAAGSGATEGGEDDDEDEDVNLPTAPLNEIADALDMASDNPRAAQQARMAERAAWRRTNQALNKGPADDANELEKMGDDEDGQDGLSTANGQSAGGPRDAFPADTQLRSFLSQGLAPLTHPSGPPPAPSLSANFHNWTDETSTLDHFYTSYFVSDASLSGLSEAHARERILKWMSNGRDPQTVAHELWVCDTARKRAEREKRMCWERYIEGVDDEELEGIYGMAEAEKQMRAETWLAKHSRWMEKAKVKEELRQKHIREHGEDPKAKTRRKRAAPANASRPYSTTQEAVSGYMSQMIKPSQRVNMKGFNDTLANLGMGMGDVDLYGMGMGGYGGSSSGFGGGYGQGFGNGQQHGGKEEYDDEGLEGLVRMGDDDGGKEEDDAYDDDY